jgi:hypothetical protein
MEVPVSGANSGVRSPGAIIQGSWSYACRLGHLRKPVGTCHGQQPAAAVGNLQETPVKIILIVDVAKIAMAIVLILELLK